MTEKHETVEPRHDLVVRRVDDGLLAYDPLTTTTHALNGTAAVVFDAVADRSDRAGIRSSVEGRLGDGSDTTLLVDLALDELVDAGLVVATTSSDPAAATHAGNVDRRRMLQRAAVGTAGVVVLPVVTSIVAPSIAAAQSGGTGGEGPGVTAPPTTAATTTTVAPVAGEVSTFAGGSGTPLADVASVAFDGTHGYVITGSSILKVNRTSGATVSTLVSPGELNGPQGMVHVGGFLYVADTGNHRIARINVVTGALTNFSGTKGNPGYTHQNSGGFAQGRYSSPTAIISAGSNVFYIADSGNHAVRQISGGTLTGFVGQFNLPGYAAGRLRTPTDIALGADGLLYVADSGNHVIRTIHQTSKAMATYAGPASVGGAAAPTGSNDGPAATAHFHTPTGLSFGPDGALYVSDTGNSRVRKVAGGQVSSLAGASGELNNPQYLTVDSGAVFVADKGNGRVARVVI